MKTPISSILFLAIILGIHVPCASAEGQRGRMSQLDFDQPTPELVAKKASPTQQIREILGSSPTAGGTIATISNSDSTARASLATPKPQEVPPTPPAPPAPSKFDWAKPAEGDSHMLIPRLKGPFVDAKNPATITTRATWSKQGANCQDLSDKQAICKKAKALKELMSRFSGSSDFIEAQCQQSCPSPGDVSVLVGFAVKNVAGGAFKMIEEGKACHYQISSESNPPKWQLLEGERGTCQCLPRSCL